MKIAQNLSDDVSKAVVVRINFEYDLVAAEAKYRDNCYKYFQRSSTGGNIGRPQDEAVNFSMEEIYKYIESSDDCQFSLEELKNVNENVALDNRIIKIRLKVKCGNKIIITENSGKLAFVFR